MGFGAEWSPTANRLALERGPLDRPCVLPLCKIVVYMVVYFVTHLEKTDVALSINNID